MLVSITAYLSFFLLMHFLLQRFANKYPVIRCFETYLKTDKNVEINYGQISRISRVVRIKEKRMDEFLYIHYDMGCLDYDEMYIDSGYLSLKHLLESIPSASHIIFTSEEVDDRWWA